MASLGSKLKGILSSRKLIRKHSWNHYLLRQGFRTGQSEKLIRHVISRRPYLLRKEIKEYTIAVMHVIQQALALLVYYQKTSIFQFLECTIPSYVITFW